MIVIGWLILFTVVACIGDFFMAIWFCIGLFLILGYL